MVGLLLWSPGARGYSPEEEARIRARVAGSGDVSEAAPALAQGLLSSRSPRLAPLMLRDGAPDVRSALVLLSQRQLLFDASEGLERREHHEASGPWRQLVHALFLPAAPRRSTPFYIYDPVTATFTLGGILPAGAPVEALARRADASTVVARPDGRIAFVAADDLTLGPRPGSAGGGTPPPEGRADRFTYRRIQEGGAVLHMVEAPLGPLGLSAALAPFYDLVRPGPERTLGVEALALRVRSRVAINGTFFIDEPSHRQYGLPIGSFIVDGQLVWSLDATDLLARDRCYVAFTRAGRAVIGTTILPGREIRKRNLQGMFDTARLGSERIGTLGSGFGWLVGARDAQAWRGFAGRQFDPSFYASGSRRARSILGIDATGRTITLLAQEEGAGSPRPMPLPELARWLVAHTPVSDAVFLDGGGSTQLVIDGRTVTRPPSASYRKNSSVLALVDPAGGAP